MHTSYRINSLVSPYQLLRFTAGLFPARPALADAWGELSYAAALERVQRIALALQDDGVRAHSRVAVFAPKSLACVQTLLAINALNASFVPVNPQLKAAQLQHILADSGASLLIAPRARLAELGCSVLGGAMPLALEDLVGAADELRCAAADVALPVGCDGDPGAILYTSGSTGLPKGVVLTQRNLVAGALSVADYLGLAPDDVVLGVLPLSFDAGLSQLTTALAAGACYVPHEFVHASQLPRLCARHGVTTLTAVPPLWHLIAEARWGDEALGLRRIANTGGHMTPELLRTLRGHFRTARPFLMYGLTESFRSTWLDPDALAQRPGSIGKAVPNAEIAVVRADGSECGPNEPGELVHRGAFVTLGYLNAPERTQQRYKPWPRQQPGLQRPELAVWSGDTVRRDAEGFLYFVGRNDEMIKSSGQRISPTEVETVIAACPGVARVCVLGLPDARLGQRLVACVVLESPAPADAALAAWCSRGLPGFMVPRQWLRFDALPLNANGKLDRPRIRQQCEARVGATASTTEAVA